jgi:hypothetical protein
MAEYIKKEALMFALCKEIIGDGDYYNGKDDMQDEIRDMVSRFPAANVAPVRHGRWIEPSRLYYGAKQYECSLCCSDTFWKKHNIIEKYPHCPNCGAKMDLED